MFSGSIIIAYDLLVGLAVCYHNLRSYGKLSTCHLAQRALRYNNREFL